MSLRNPYWTYSDAELTLENYYYYDEYTGWLDTPYSDNPITAPVVYGSLGPTDIIDFIPVTLYAGREYMFSAIGSYPIELSIYDAEGYLLLSTDASDVGLSEFYNQDSIVGFAPIYSGDYLLNVSDYTNLYNSYNVSGLDSTIVYSSPVVSSPVYQPTPVEMEIDEIEYGEVEYGEVEYGEVEYGEVEYGEVEYGEVEYGEVEYGEVEYGEVEYGEVEYGEIEYDAIEPIEIGLSDMGSVEAGEIHEETLPLGSYDLTAIADVFGTIMFLDGLVETVTSTSHTIEYSGDTFDYSEVDGIITTVVRDGNFTNEFAAEIAESFPDSAGISYSTAVTLIGQTNMEETLLMVAGADGNYVG